ncbi:glycerate kinase, putative [Eimeria brunetti]|uniref:Glycerate kinase, putative n=1 Tax=Eimeria brunetti TaxID=51314 RepID=U6LKR9_9EIME|nr:glycerate kinase, putative [Eimeria brunetti]
MERQTGVLEKLLGEGTEHDRVPIIAACTKARSEYPHAAGTADFAAANGDWPLARWIALEVLKRKSQWSGDSVDAHLPLIVGITGPQGCGKTTLCASLIVRYIQPTIVATGLRASWIGAAEAAEAASIVEGQVEWQKKQNIMLPKYDKSQMDGAGDRSKEDVPLDATSLDVFLLEGWMLGFRHVDPKVLTEWNFPEQQQAELHQINESLKDYESLYAYIDMWLIVKVETPKWVYNWRRQQEEDTRIQTGSGMTAGEVNGFVDRFMPLYTVYLPGLYANPPLSGKDPDDRRCLLIEVTEQRTVKHAAFL